MTSGPPTARERLTAVLVVEVIALLIALVEPLTPSKTGSKWSPAELFTADPGYLEKVLASFIVVNLIIAILGIVAWIVSKVQKSK